MLKLVEDNITNYKSDEEATAPTNERLARFYQFLEKNDYQKFFVWVDFENPTLMTDFYSAPQFYEAGKFEFNPQITLYQSNAPILASQFLYLN